MIVLTSIFLKGTSIRAITIFPFIILRDEKDKTDKVLINHEKIHIRQQLEMLVIPFYIWYGIEALARRIGGNKSAYGSLSFENEAFIHQYDLGYLKRRKPYAWLEYI